MTRTICRNRFLNKFTCIRSPNIWIATRPGRPSPASSQGLETDWRGSTGINHNEASRSSQNHAYGPFWGAFSRQKNYFLGQTIKNFAFCMSFIVNLILHCVIQGIYPTKTIYQNASLSNSYFLISWFAPPCDISLSWLYFPELRHLIGSSRTSCELQLAQEVPKTLLYWRCIILTR